LAASTTAAPEDGVMAAPVMPTAAGETACDISRRIESIWAFVGAWRSFATNVCLLRTTFSKRARAALRSLTSLWTTVSCRCSLNCSKETSKWAAVLARDRFRIKCAIFSK
jgi:hypothetical protein